jgi:hypothetical protein
MFVKVARRVGSVAARIIGLSPGHGLVGAGLGNARQSIQHKTVKNQGMLSQYSVEAKRVGLSTFVGAAKSLWSPSKVRSEEMSNTRGATEV